jgi:hypothetical protein
MDDAMSAITHGPLSRRTAMLVVVTFVLVGLLAYLVRPSGAAEISCITTWGATADNVPAEWYPSGRRPNRDTCETVLIKGPIEAGDSLRFVEVVRKNHPFLDEVLLWSPGGSVEEGMEIGRLIRKAMLSTEAPGRDDGWPPSFGLLYTPLATREICKSSSCNCASACFLIWAAGSNRRGSVLGLHRPTIKSTSFAAMAPDRAAVLYRQLLLDMDKYLVEMEIPRRFIEVMKDTSPADIYWLSRDQAYSMSDVPSIEAWLAATCGSMAKPPMAIPNFEKFWEGLGCQNRKIRISRDAIKEVR